MGARSNQGPRALVRAAVLVACGLGAAVPVGAEAPERLLESVRGGRLAARRAVVVSGIEVRLGPARLAIEAATLFPVVSGAGRTVEVVALGRLRLRLEPPDSIEAGQLDLFTGSPRLDTELEAVALAFGDPARVAALVERGRSVDVAPEVVAAAETFWRDWLERVERSDAGVESSLFRALAGDPPFRGYLAAWCRAPGLGEFLLQVDPEDAEQVTLAQFSRIDVRGWDRKRLARHIRLQQRKGRFLGMTIDDLGAWDVWMSSAWDGTDAAGGPGAIGFEPRHYQLDVTVRRDGRGLGGVARIDLEATQDGRTSLPLELYRDLLIRRVSDGSGRPLFFFRSGREVVVALREPARRGDRLVLEVSWEGRVVEWVGRRTYDLADTDSWYPHCGTVDRATYDVTLRWPRDLDLIAGGTRVAGGSDRRHEWERRRVDVPVIAYSFALGRFTIERRTIGDLELTVAFARSRGTVAETQREETIDALERALSFLEQRFGPYPLDTLAVVTLPREYSQSYLGFVTLTDSVVEGGSFDPAWAGDWIRDTTIAHELAHQWWGNLLGWSGYRDQWLSEAVANYAGTLFFARNAREDGTTLARLSAGWRDSLERRLDNGLAVDDLGPVVLGARLNSSVASYGYRAIVYRKGAAVLAMLARAVGEGRFLETLRGIVETRGGGVLTTQAFLDAVQAETQVDLTGFARQYVYGTGIPLVYYCWSAEPADGGGFEVRVEARRRRVPETGGALVRFGEGGWDVVRAASEPADGATALVVPYRWIEESDGPGAPQVQLGHLTIQGAEHESVFPAARPPSDFRLDPNGEILAHVHSASAEPKRAARLRAEDLAAEGRVDDAERWFLRAIDEPVGEGPAVVLPWMRDLDSAARDEDARARLGLARIRLDRGDVAGAVTWLGAVEQALEGEDRFRLARDVLRARLLLRDGDVREPFALLRRTLRPMLEADTRSWADVLARVRLNSEPEALAEAAALLAAAARETGDEDVFERALALARQRRVDVSALDAAATASTR